MLARRFSMICFFTALLGMYVAIRAAEIDPTHVSAIACEKSHTYHCEQP